MSERKITDTHSLPGIKPHMRIDILQGEHGGFVVGQAGREGFVVGAVAAFSTAAEAAEWLGLELAKMEEDRIKASSPTPQE